MAERYAALLRGINVGRAKRVAMADLRALVEELGGRDVRTLLNSGNVVLTAPGSEPKTLASRIEGALEKKTGISARVTVLTATELDRIVADNPLLDVATSPSLLLVAVLAEPADRALLEPLLERDWRPGALALGERVAYVWCPNGTLESPIPAEIERLVGDAVTSRNWATIGKLHALATAA